MRPFEVNTVARVRKKKFIKLEIILQLVLLKTFKCRKLLQFDRYRRMLFQCNYAEVFFSTALSQTAFLIDFLYANVGVKISLLLLFDAEFI